MATNRRALMSQAYDEIKRRIITLELKPGEKVDDYELSAELEISRTPVREAIFMLGSEGLVEIRPRAGFTVRALDLLDINDIFEAHTVIATTVVRLAAIRAQERDIEAMVEAAEAVEAAIDRRDHFEITSFNAMFHRAEAEAAHSRHLCSMAEKIYDHEQRLAYLCFGGGGREWGGLDELFAGVKRHHRMLLDCYRQRDPKRAQQVSLEHSRLFMRRVQTCFVTDDLADLVIDENLVGAEIKPFGQG